ncbi:hypothetical protein LIER_12433 [Lithospermum erythrorhizon]|uniref:Retrotransposon gag domain-containing protein n=1 Tax=Lithospermum erythrorhizon TaxID=34254 RepID=A0AAV3PUR2_LITER
MEPNIANRPGVSTRAQSALAPNNQRGAQAIPNKGPLKTPRPPCMVPSHAARAQSHGPRPSPEMFNPGAYMRQDKCEDRDTKAQRGERRRGNKNTTPRPSTRRDAGGRCNADLQKQVEELKALLKDITPGRGPVKHNTLLPFSNRPRHATMPREFRIPKFKTFKWFGDPRNHLKSFDSQLSFWASDDEVYKRAFPSCLLGQALKWFHKLSPNSIDCWQDVVDLFMDKFGPSIVADADERTLMEIQQKAGETLRSYATWFEEVATNILTANEKVTMISFFHGLRYGPLKEKLVLEPPSMRNE